MQELLDTVVWLTRNLTKNLTKNLSKNLTKIMVSAGWYLIMMMNILGLSFVLSEKLQNISIAETINSFVCQSYSIYLLVFIMEITIHNIDTVIITYILLSLRVNENLLAHATTLISVNLYSLI